MKPHKLKRYLFGLLALFVYFGTVHAYEIVKCNVRINCKIRPVAWALIPDAKNDLVDPYTRPKFISSLNKDEKDPIDVWPSYPGVYLGSDITTIGVRLKYESHNGISQLEFKKDHQNAANELEWRLRKFKYNDVRQAFLQSDNEFLKDCSTENLKFEPDGSNYKELKKTTKEKINRITSEWDKIENEGMPAKEKLDICSIS